MAFAACPICVERAGEERERVEIARVRLEGDLQLRERLHPVVRGVSREIELGRHAGLGRVRPVLKQALDDLEGVVTPPELGELRGGDRELGHRAVGVLGARERLGQAQVRQGVGRVELDDLAEDFDGFRVASGRCRRVATSSSAASASLVRPSCW